MVPPAWVPAATAANSAVMVVTHDERLIAGFGTMRRMRDGGFVAGELDGAAAHARAGANGSTSLLQA